MRRKLEMKKDERGQKEMVGPQLLGDRSKPQDLPSSHVNLTHEG